MKGNKAKSAKNLVYSVLGQIITIAIGMILPRLFVVSYGSDVNGLVHSVNQFVVYLSLFEAGIGTVSLQALYGPVARQDKESINRILSATNIYYKRASVGYLIALVALSLAYPLIVDSTLDYFTVMGVVLCSGISNVVLFLFQGKYRLLLQAEGKNYISTNLSTIIVVLTGLTKVVLILLGFSVLPVMVVSVCINLIQVIYIVAYVKTKYRWIDLKANPDMAAIKEKNFTLIHQISGMVFHNTDILILTIVFDLKIVSVYSMYKLIITYLESFLTTITNSLGFVLGQSFNTDIDGYKQKIDAFEACYSAIAFSLFTVAQSLFVPFMKLYVGDVSDANYQDYMLAFMFVAIALLNVMRTPMLYTINYAGHFKKTTPQTIAETIINIVVSLVCILFFGVYGVLLGTIVALFYRTNDIIIYANKKILNRSPFKTYAIHFANLVLYIILSAFFGFVFKGTKNFAEFVLYGCIYLTISLLAFFAAQTIVSPKRMKQVIKILVRRKEK